MLLDAGETEAGREHLRNALALESSLAQAHMILGRDARDREDYEFALTEFRAAIAADPALADGHLKIARTLVFLERIPEALPSFERFLELSPDRHDVAIEVAWYYAGLPEDEGGDPERAVTWATHAVDGSGGEHVVSLSTLAFAHSRNGKKGKALHWQRRAVELSQGQEQRDMLRRLQLLTSDRARPSTW